MPNFATRAQRRENIFSEDVYIGEFEKFTVDGGLSCTLGALYGMCSHYHLCVENKNYILYVHINANNSFSFFVPISLISIKYNIH